MPSAALCGADAIVVCPAEFRPQIATWVNYRESQGTRIAVVESEATAGRMLEKIKAVAGEDSAKPKAVILFGDCVARRDGGPMDPKTQVPTHYQASPVTAAFGSTKTMATDAPYGDLDGDGKPDTAVGRIPIDRPDQIGPLVKRIREFEASRDYGVWRQKIDLVAGVGGFGMLIDGAIESVTRSIITSRVPGAMRMNVTYASPSSPFFPGYKTFPDVVANEFNEGGMFWVYAGHGQVSELDRVPPTAFGKPILRASEIGKLKRPAARAPIALMLACFTGAYDASDDCLGERMLLEPGGPIAVIAGSRITMPYGNASLATSLVDAWFKKQPATMGQAWLDAVQGVSQDRPSSAAPSMMDALATMMSPKGADLPAERREHAGLYNLLGDPLLRLQHAGKLEMKAPVGVEPEAPIEITGNAAYAGRLIVELHRFGFGYPAGADTSELSTAQKFQLAKQTLIESKVIETTAGEFRATMNAPKTNASSVVILARLEGSDRFAIGSARVLIRKVTRRQP